MQSQSTLPPRVPRICRNCGREFTALRSEVLRGHGILCSRACWGGHVTRVCATCGIAFTVDQNVVAKGRGIFCSKACYSSHPGGLTPRDIERFWRQVDKSGACWLWTGRLTRQGYGAFYFGGKAARRTIAAHRVAYELMIGPIPQDQFLCHSCDVRRCVNPACLVPGTQAENIADAVRKGRHGRTRLSPETVLLMHQRLNEGETTTTVARSLGVDQAMVYRIGTGEAWKALGLTPVAMRSRAKLIIEQVLTIRERLATGESQRSIERALGIPQKSISDIARGITWKWIDHPSVPKTPIKRRAERGRRHPGHGRFTLEEWDALCAQFDNRCVACGADAPLQADHVVPISQGGSNLIANIQPLCARCNGRKHCRTIDYRIGWQSSR